MDISICSDNYLPAISDQYLETLKYSIKEQIKDDWTQIVWLTDLDAEILSEDLYPRLFKTENQVRRLINEIMFKSCGVNWWDTYVPIKIKDKYNGRTEGYKDLVSIFNDIDDKLMSIDTGDLKEIVIAKKMKWPDKIDDYLFELLCSGTDQLKNRAIKLIREETVEGFDMWDSIFSKFFDKSFRNIFRQFEKNRNHIAHTKLLDRCAYDTINRSIIDMEAHIKNAHVKLNKLLLSEEAITEFKQQRAEEIAEYNQWVKETKENDANISILKPQEIMELYEDTLLEAYTDITDALRFRNDLTFSDMLFDTDSLNGLLFSVTSKIDGKTLEFYYSASIIDEEGSSSEVTISCSEISSLADDDGYTASIEYTNGEAVYDEDQGYYMPATEDGISLYDVENFISSVVEYIDDCIENLKKKVDNMRYSYAKNGISLPIADGIECPECLEEYICTDDSIAPIGTCLNCGEHIDIVECERCGNFFEDDTYDEVKLCENCRNHYEEE